MKKIKICMFVMLFAMSLFVLAGCSNKNQDNTQSSSASRQETESATTNGTSGTEGSTSAGNGTSGSNKGNTESSSSRESTGVLDELGDDMEQGMDDLLDGPGATSASNESK